MTSSYQPQNSSNQSLTGFQEKNEKLLPVQNKHHILEMVGINSHKSYSRGSIQVGEVYTFKFGCHSHSTSVPTSSKKDGIETNEIVGVQRNLK